LEEVKKNLYIATSLNISFKPWFIRILWNLQMLGSLWKLKIWWWLVASYKQVHLASLYVKIENTMVI
jgi:hypothetical protein